MNDVRTALRPLVLAVAVLGTGACGFVRSLMGTNTVDLSKADVKSMSVDLRKDRKTICPREPVQMAIFLEASFEGEKEVKKFETWQGRGSVNKNDKLDFADFAFHSDFGQFDEEGWFSPNRNVLATVDKEFELKSVLKKRPDKFSFDTKYKPDYFCIKSGGKDGSPGQSGHAGSPGQGGSSGRTGSSTAAGGRGTDGGSGGPGSNGGDGGAGPSLKAFATLAKTAYYEKLVAIKIAGDTEDFLLAPVDQPIVLSANGGPGGAGGKGGNGGPGGSGGAGNPGGDGGNGGRAGDGGRGGNGGPGGSIELVVDARFSELASIRVEAAGGPGGGAGNAGSGGSGGSAGSGFGQRPQSGTAGAQGAGGGDGASGSKGPDGRASSRTGDVRAEFAGLGGVTILGETADAPAAEADPKGKKPAKKEPPAGKGKKGGK